VSDNPSATNGDDHAPPPCAPEPLPAVDPQARTQQIIDTTQTVLTALMLAFIFRAFLVEAFIIPTGSMAQSLLGAHATRTCPACGYEYDFSTGGDCLCPNCHLRTPLVGEPVASKAGDRILVHKWPYVLGGIFGPQRWDVIVFRNPADPSENYIKRLIGLPGESVEIIDGDVFIADAKTGLTSVARKTPAAQSVLWFLVFDQNYIPRASASEVAGPRWVAEPPSGDANAGWSGLDSRVIRYTGLDDRERAIHFQPNDDEEYFQDLYAYNRGTSESVEGRSRGSAAGEAPCVRDVRVLAEVTFRRGDGACRWELDRDGYRFVAELRRDGTVLLTMTPPRAAPSLIHGAPVALPPFRYNHPYVVEFGHVDYRVHLKVDGREVLSTADEEYAPNLAAIRHLARIRPVDLRIHAAALELELRGLRIDRDVYYTYRDRYTKRAYPGHPFKLEPDEYFVLGDNSPDSRDGREWTERGPQLPDDYRIGTVRADQIVGPAAFVYLPGLLAIDPDGRSLLPDLGRVRFVR
jgi:signal peptidase I